MLWHCLFNTLLGKPFSCFITTSIQISVIDMREITICTDGDWLKLLCQNVVKHFHNRGHFKKQAIQQHGKPMVFKYLGYVKGKGYRRGLWEINEGEKEGDFFTWLTDWLTGQTIYIFLSSHDWPGSNKACLGNQGRFLGFPNMMSFHLVIITLGFVEC